MFLLNCQSSQDFRKPVGNFPKEIWTRSLVYSGLVYSSGTRTTTSHFARAERYDYFSRDSNIILLSLCHIHKHWALTKDQPKVYFQSWTKVQIKSKLASRPKRIYNPIMAMVFLTMFTFQTTLRGKHYRHLIAKMGVVDMFG